MAEHISARYGGRLPKAKVARVAVGGAATGSITVSGVRPHHVLLEVLEFTHDGTATVTDVLDRTGVASISANDTVALSGGNQFAANSRVVVRWLEVEP